MGSSDGGFPSEPVCTPFTPLPLSQRAELLAGGDTDDADPPHDGPHAEQVKPRVQHVFSLGRLHPILTISRVAANQQLWNPVRPARLA